MKLEVHLINPLHSPASEHCNHKYNFYILIYLYIYLLSVIGNLSNHQQSFEYNFGTKQNIFCIIFPSYMNFCSVRTFYDHQRRGDRLQRQHRTHHCWLLYCFSKHLVKAFLTRNISFYIIQHIKAFGKDLSQFISI